MMAQYEFAARPPAGRAPEQPPVKLYWYDGGLLPPRPPFVPDDAPLATGDGGGGIFVGERGVLMYETYGNNPRVFPEPVAKAADALPKTFPRVTTSHELNWAQACKGQGTASSPFSYAAELTETMLLGMVALRAGQGRKLHYDAPNMRFTNADDANQYLTRVAPLQRVEYRIAAADCNPYVALAASIGSGLYGIEHKIEPTDAIVGNSYEKKHPAKLDLPRTLWEAAQRLRKSKAAEELFGADFVEHWAATREWEEREFRKHITDWELSRYFEII